MQYFLLLQITSIRVYYIISGHLLTVILKIVFSIRNLTTEKMLNTSLTLVKTRIISLNSSQIAQIRSKMQGQEQVVFRRAGKLHNLKKTFSLALKFQGLIATENKNQGQLHSLINCQVKTQEEYCIKIRELLELSHSDLCHLQLRVREQ